MSTTYNLLLVEDEPSLGYLLKEYLRIKGFSVTLAKDGLEALSLIDKKHIDLAILDVMMPKMDGFELASKIRDVYPELSFIFLTSRSLKIDVLKGFSLGAVDYLKKPIDEEELVVRIQAILQRIQPQILEEKQNIYMLGQFQFDVKNQQLKTATKEVLLTTREAELLEILATNQNNLTTHKAILTKLWGDNDYFNRKSLNVFITRLRTYLKEENVQIENVHGKGFILRNA
ncbi:response regulator transcription factor [Flavobacterium sp. ASW18X]|uniref:response regulator transcription factor n=1 Tax=Flavobacterium sp. ASW18X TaxID=2572595 RepID=UPI0010AE73BE|nr:response regulator transcription factor [Flavobacterium sp. ASW18X]TKD56565.1 response regulator transcription factor [Flavobacterium sp. ASW18X]